MSESTASLCIAVEATRLGREVRGIGRYVRAMLPRLVAQRPDVRLVLYTKARDVAATAAEYDAVPGMRGRVEVQSIGALRHTEADVVWYPWNVVRPAPPAGVAVVATIHDIAPLALPDPRPLRGWRKNTRWRRSYLATAERATLIVADSQFTATEVHRVLGVAHHRMRVVPLAADDVVRRPTAAEDAAVLDRLGVRTPFVLAVGAADRRKNLGLLDRAMPRVAAAIPGASLVLAGPRRNAAAERAPWKRTLGFIADAELATLYRAAACLVMPSKYEGFGLPLLEAMHAGTPTICARSSSLPEVAGDAAWWVDPDDAGQLAAAISLVLSDGTLRREMSAAGVVQAARFTWDETARRTLAAFDDAASLYRQTRRRAAPTFWQRSVDALWHRPARAASTRA